MAGSNANNSFWTTGYLMGALAIVATTLPTGARAIPSQPEDAINYRQFIEIVGQNSPAARRQHLQVAAAKASGNGIQRLPDPMILASREERLAFSITQEIPWPTAFRAQDLRVEAQTRQAEAILEQTIRTVRLEAAQDFVATIALNKNLALALKNLSELTKIRDYTTSRRRQGLGGHGDILQIQIDMELAHSRITALQRTIENRKEGLRQLMGATGQLVEFQLEWPQELLSTQIPSVTTDLAAKRIEADSTLALASLEAQRAALRPSFTLGASRMQQEDGMWMNGVMMGVRLPIFSWGSAAALADRLSIRNETTRLEQTLRAEERTAAARIVERRRVQAEENLAALQKRILLLAEEHLSLTLSEFVSGKGTLDGVIATERNLLGLKRAEVEAIRQLATENLTRQAIAEGVTTVLDTSAVSELGLSPDMSTSGGSSMGSQESSTMQSGMSPRSGKPTPPSKPKSLTPDGSMESDDSSTNAPKSGGMGM